MRTYKGDWNIAERVAWAESLDYSVPSTAKSNRYVGDRLVLLTNEHTNSEIGIDTGNAFLYDRQFKQILQCVFQKKRPA